MSSGGGASVAFGRRGIFEDAQPADHEFIDFEAVNAGPADRKPADGDSADSQRAERERTRGEPTDGQGADARRFPITPPRVRDISQCCHDEVRIAIIDGGSKVGPDNLGAVEVICRLPTRDRHCYPYPMDGFTILEQHVFDIFARYDGDDGKLLALLKTAAVKERTNTGVGFFTDFEVDRSRPPMESRDRMIPLADAIHVLAQSKSLPMSFILFLDGDRYPVSLEGVHMGLVVVAGEAVEESVDLRLGDLADLLPLREGDTRWSSP